MRESSDGLVTCTLSDRRAGHVQEPDKPGSGTKRGRGDREHSSKVRASRSDSFQKPANTSVHDWANEGQKLSGLLCRTGAHMPKSRQVELCWSFGCCVPQPGLARLLARYVPSVLPVHPGPSDPVSGPRACAVHHLESRLCRVERSSRLCGQILELGSRCSSLWTAARSVWS